MSGDRVRASVDGNGIATVTLANAARHNAFDDEMIGDLHRIFRSLAEDAAVRIVILAAQGKSFSAGADLAWMQRMANYGYEENLADARALADMLHCLNTLPRPTIARVQGAAFGGAVGLVSCCDMAVGTPHASFCLSEVRIGLVPATIAPYVIRAIGERAARRYFQTAERFDAGTAHSLGLLSDVVDEHAIDTRIDDLAGQLLANGPAALAAAKALALRVSGRTIDETVLSETSELIARVRVSDEGQEGLTAFLEKRKPAWTSS